MTRAALIVGGLVVGGAGALIARRLRDLEQPGERLTIELEIERELVVEDSGWAFEMANAALDRLAAATPELARFHVRVLWLSRVLAFTVPGRALYLSRTLMDRPGFSEAQAAFALAHEAAHHLLGHLGKASRTSLVRARLSDLVIGARNELSADAYALGACLAAGYTRSDVMKIWDVMEHYAEDYGHIDDDDDHDHRSLFEKLSGHPSISERRDALTGIR